jgi:hypothetical protein
MANTKHAVKMVAAVDPFVFCVCNKRVPIHAYNESVHCVHKRTREAPMPSGSWSSRHGRATHQLGVLKRDKQSTVHTNLITVDGLWDMDWENSIYIEKYDEVKGTPARQKRVAHDGV